VDASPWAYVYLGNKNLGSSYDTHKLEVGTHIVTLVNPVLKEREQREVTIKKGKLTRLKVTLGELPASAKASHSAPKKAVRPESSSLQGYLMVKVSPWAYIYLGNKKLGKNGRKYKIKAGTHTITLINPVLKKKLYHKVTIVKGKLTSVQLGF